MASIDSQTASDLSAAAYQNLENGSTVDGYMLVTHEIKDGFRGQVWESTSDPGNVVFAFGGTDLSTTAEEHFGDLGTDINLASGTLSSQFRDALNFHNSYVQENQGIFVNVTGHSLGGALAEYVTADGNNAGITFQGGITFEAPGIEQITGVVSNTSLIDYIDPNDPVGTFEGFGTTQGINEHVGHTSLVSDPINPVVQYVLQSFDSLMSSAPTDVQGALGRPPPSAGKGAHLSDWWRTL